MDSFYEDLSAFSEIHRLVEDRPIHFIEGDDGGYAIAAKHLKDQLAKA